MVCILSFRPHPEEHRKSAIADLRASRRMWVGLGGFMVRDAQRCEVVHRQAPHHEADWARRLSHGSFQHHGSRLIAMFGAAFIRRFHSLMYSRMKASSVAGAVMTPLRSVFTRPGMPSPRCM